MSDCRRVFRSLLLVSAGMLIVNVVLVIKLYDFDYTNAFPLSNWQYLRWATPRRLLLYVIKPAQIVDFVRNHPQLKQQLKVNAGMIQARNIPEARTLISILNDDYLYSGLTGLYYIAHDTPPLTPSSHVSIPNYSYYTHYIPQSHHQLYPPVAMWCLANSSSSYVFLNKVLILSITPSLKNCQSNSI